MKCQKIFSVSALQEHDMLDTKAGGGGGGGTRLFLESVTKSVTKPQKSITLKFCHKSNTRKFNLEFYSLVALKISLRCSVFLPLTPESVRAGDVWAYADVITKFSGVSCVRADAPL